jgi:hypothetical protein
MPGSTGAKNKEGNTLATPRHLAETCTLRFLPLAPRNHEPTLANASGFTKESL